MAKCFTLNYLYNTIISLFNELVCWICTLSGMLTSKCWLVLTNICSCEHCFAIVCNLYQNGNVYFGIKHFKKRTGLFLLSSHMCVFSICVFGYHIQSSPFSVCKINRSDILSSMLLDTYLTSINKSIYTRVVLENSPCIWNV